MYDIEKLRFWCQKVIPLVYEDSLSYYELLCKVVKKLNEVIESVDGIPELIAEMLSDENIGEIVSRLLNNLEEQIANANEELSETATADRGVGTLVWLNGYLYRATEYIDAGDRYVSGGNVEKATVEEVIKDLQLAFTDNYETGERVASADREVGELVWFKNELLLIKEHIDEGNAYTDANSENVDFSNLFLTIENAISSEATARANADTALGERITSEIANEATARANADTALGERITSEIADEATARANADTALGERITSEATARSEADSALGTRIDNEATAREQADTLINSRITTICGNLKLFSSFDGETDTDKMLTAISDGTGVILDRDIELNALSFNRKETFYVFGLGHTISMNGKFDSIAVYGQDLYFLDCVFDGTNGGYFDVQSVNLVDVRFHNCKFVNFTHDIFVGTLQTFSFLNCYFKGNSAWIINASRIDAVWVNNSNFEGGYGFLHCTGACYNLSIRDTVIESATYGAVIIDGNGSDVIFDTVYLEDNTVNFRINAEYAGNYTITNIHANIKASTDFLVEVYKNDVSVGQYGQINISNCSVNQGNIVKLGDTSVSYFISVKNCSIAGNVNANMFDVSSIVSKANQAVRSKEIQFLQWSYRGIVSSGGQWINLYSLVPELNQHVLLSAYIQASANVSNFTTQTDPGGSIRLYGDGVNESVYDLVITYC